MIDIQRVKLETSATLSDKQYTKIIHFLSNISYKI